MPTYEYECQACEATFERFQSMSAAPVRTCPECGKRRARRKIGGGAALLFKGSGFYITDYRGSDYSAKAKSDTETKPAAESAKAAGPVKPAEAAKPESKKASA